MVPEPEVGRGQLLVDVIADSLHLSSLQFHVAGQSRGFLDPPVGYEPHDRHATKRARDRYD